MRCHYQSRFGYLKRPLFGIALLALIANHSGRAQTAEPCPGAAEWNRNHSSEVHSDGGVATNPSNPSLSAELHARFEEDQDARRQWLAEPKNEVLALNVERIDTSNLDWLRKTIAQTGFPSASQVGNEGVHFAWLLLQHADTDPALQSKLLPVLEQRYSAGELPANDLARFTDRILKAHGKPQRYGTQFNWMADDFKIPQGKALARIDSDRSRLGLMPLTDYVCTLRIGRGRIQSGGN